MSNVSKKKIIKPTKVVQAKKTQKISKLLIKIWCNKSNFSRKLTNKFLAKYTNIDDIKKIKDDDAKEMLKTFGISDDKQSTILNEINKLKHEPLSRIKFSPSMSGMKKAKGKKGGRGFGGVVRKSTVKRKKAKKLGFSVGGSKDVNTFRNNIDNGILPDIDSITYEGIFYDYYFDTETNAKGIDDENPDNLDEKNDELRDNNMFYPTYCYAKKDNNYYLSVGMNSNIDEEQFERSKLNCVIVLDISGSMGLPFDYKKSKKSKMEVACESLICLISQLNYDDKFGLVLFNEEAKIVSSLKMLSEMTMTDIKAILKLREGGGTHFDAGYRKGTKCFINGKKKYTKNTNNNENEYDNRMIYLTDAIPTVAVGTSQDLLDLVEINAVKKKIYSTFIGICLFVNNNISDYYACYHIFLFRCWIRF